MAVPFISFSCNNYHYTKRSIDTTVVILVKKKQKGAHLVSFEHRNLNNIKSKPQDKQHYSHTYVRCRLINLRPCLVPKKFQISVL